MLGDAKFAEATLGSDGETLELKFFRLNELPTLSGGIERLLARHLRAEADLPVLLELVDTEIPRRRGGNYLAELRALVGPRPLFAPGANVLVSNDQGHWLLLRDADTKRWTLPGGGLELGETLEEGARRELFEETGLAAGSLEELKFYAGAEYRFTSPHGDVIDNVSMLYRAHGVSGSVVPQPEEVLEYGWFAPDALPPAEESSGPLAVAMLDSASRL